MPGVLGYYRDFEVAPVVLCRHPVDVSTSQHGLAAVHSRAAALDALCAAAEADARFRVAGAAEEAAHAGGKKDKKKDKKADKKKGKKGSKEPEEEVVAPPRAGLDLDLPSTSIGAALGVACSRHVRLLMAALHHADVTTAVPATCGGGKLLRTLTLQYLEAALTARGAVARVVSEAVAQAPVAAGVLGVEAPAVEGESPDDVSPVLAAKFWPVSDGGDSGDSKAEEAAGDADDAAGACLCMCVCMCVGLCMCVCLCVLA